MNEKIQTDILLNGYKILQNPSAFMFGIDAVLLAYFAKSEIRKNDVVVDLCTGNGIVPLLLESAASAEKIFGVEIQKDSAALAKESVSLNGLEEKIKIYNEDLKCIVPQIFKKHSISCVTCNPPYMIVEHGKNNPSDSKAIARHEIFCTLEDVISTAEKLLKPHGKFFLIHRPFRLVEIFNLMERYSLMPKRIQFVQPEEGKEANLVLIEARKNAKDRLKVEKVLNVYENSKNENAAEAVLAEAASAENEKDVGQKENSPQNENFTGSLSNHNKRRYSKEIIEIYNSFK